MQLPALVGANSPLLRLALLLLLGGGDVVHKDDNVTFLHNVQFALLSVLAGFFDFGHTGLTLMECFEIVKCTNFGFDKAPFKVRVDDPGRLWGHCAFHYSPGTDFFRTSSVKRLQTQCRTSSPNETWDHRFDFGLGTFQSGRECFFFALFQKRL